MKSAWHDFRIQTGTLKYPNPLYHVKNQTIIMILSTDFAVLTKSWVKTLVYSCPSSHVMQFEI